MLFNTNYYYYYYYYLSFATVVATRFSWLAWTVRDWRQFIRIDERHDGHDGNGGHVVRHILGQSLLCLHVFFCQILFNFPVFLQVSPERRAKNNGMHECKQRVA